MVSRASSRLPCSGSVWGPEDNLHKQGLFCDSYVLPVANQTASGQFSCLRLPSRRRSAWITSPCHCIRFPYVGSSDLTQSVSFALHIDISQPMSGGLTAQSLFPQGSAADILHSSTLYIYLVFFWF